MEDSLADLRQTVLDAELRRADQLARIADLKEQGAFYGPAEVVLNEIETTLRSAHRHYAFVAELLELPN